MQTQSARTLSLASVTRFDNSVLLMRQRARSVYYLYGQFTASGRSASALYAHGATRGAVGNVAPWAQNVQYMSE